MKATRKNQKIEVSKVENSNNIETIEQTNNEVINSSFVVSDNELLKQLTNKNIELFVNKVTTNKSIWKKEILTTFKSEKIARKKLRDLQFNLCIKLNKAYLTQIGLNESANELLNFSTTNLIDVKNYSQVSIENTNNKRQIIDANYKLMFLVLKM